MMRLISGYIGREVFNSISIALLVIVGLDAVTAVIDETDAIRNNYNFSDVLIYVSITIPSRVHEYIPVATLVGCLFGLGQLANNSELIVMRAAGISVFQIVIFVFRPVLVFILVGIFLGEYIAPYLDQLANGQRQYLRKGESTLDSASGLWIREGAQFMHFNAVFPGGVLFGVARYNFSDDKRISEASFASRATYNSAEGYWVEENVSITHFHADRTEVDKKLTRIWRSELTPQLLLVNALPADRLSMSTLFYYMNFLKQQGAKAAVYELAFWRKLIQPLVILGLVMLGISFVFGPLRNSAMGSKIFVGVLVGVVFNIFQDMIGPTSIVMGFSPLFAVMTPVLMCIAAGLYLLRRER